MWRLFGCRHCWREQSRVYNGPAWSAIGTLVEYLMRSSMTHGARMEATERLEDLSESGYTVVGLVCEKCGDVKSVELEGNHVGVMGAGPGGARA